MAQKLKGLVTIVEDRCKGCGLCVAACSEGLLSLSDATLNDKGYHPAQFALSGGCTGCCNCALMCPDCAITVDVVTQQRRTP